MDEKPNINTAASAISDKDITAARKLSMTLAWEKLRSGKGSFKECLAEARAEVAQTIGIPVPELMHLLALNMNGHRYIKPKSGFVVPYNSKDAGFVLDDDQPEFYRDLQTNSPKDKIYWLKEQLNWVKRGEAAACLFDTVEEANQYHTYIPAAIKYLGWKHSRSRPGYYTEVVEVGPKFKLRIKRLR